MPIAIQHLTIIISSELSTYAGREPGRSPSPAAAHCTQLAMARPLGLGFPMDFTFITVIQCYSWSSIELHLFFVTSYSYGCYWIRPSVNFLHIKVDELLIKRKQQHEQVKWKSKSVIVTLARVALRVVSQEPQYMD